MVLFLRWMLIRRENFETVNENFAELKKSVDKAWRFWNNKNFVNQDPAELKKVVQRPTMTKLGVQLDENHEGKQLHKPASR